MIQEAGERLPEHDIQIDFRDKKPVTEQIYTLVLSQIQQGILVPGDRLPTVRQLANRLKINFNTVARAYRLLDQEGLISTRQGRGTYVLDPLPQLPEQRSSDAGADEHRGTIPEADAVADTEVNSGLQTSQMDRGQKDRLLEQIVWLVIDEAQKAGVTLDEVLRSLQQVKRTQTTREEKHLVLRSKHLRKKQIASRPPTSVAEERRKKAPLLKHRPVKRTTRRL